MGGGRRATHTRLFAPAGASGFEAHSPREGHRGTDQAPATGAGTSCHRPWWDGLGGSGDRVPASGGLGEVALVPRTGHQSPETEQYSILAAKGGRQVFSPCSPGDARDGPGASLVGPGTRGDLEADGVSKRCAGHPGCVSPPPPSEPGRVDTQWGTPPRVPCLCTAEGLLLVLPTKSWTDHEPGRCQDWEPRKPRPPPLQAVSRELGPTGMWHPTPWISLGSPG